MQTNPNVVRIKKMDTRKDEKSKCNEDYKKELTYFALYHKHQKTDVTEGELANLFGISRSTLRRWKDAFNEDFLAVRVLVDDSSYFTSANIVCDLSTERGKRALVTVGIDTSDARSRKSMANTFFVHVTQMTIEVIH